MDNNFNTTIESLFKGMDSFITTKTVVGDAVRFEDGTIILPLVEVAFGVGAGAYAGDQKNNAGGGMGGRIIPNSVLVIQNGNSKLIHAKGQEGFNKIIEMVPDVINKFSNFGKSNKDKNAKEETSTEE
ncbi:MAG TPA: sporulation protein [Clostridiales bacterium]|nr:sporulation protein [Clostridiales bacterium]